MNDQKVLFATNLAASFRFAVVCAEVADVGVKVANVGVDVKAYPMHAESVDIHRTRGR